MNEEHTNENEDRRQGGGEVIGEETVGEILLTARERAGLSLVEVSQETRIPAKNIEYLETDNFEALPAKVYVKGFLRTYAGILGLDVEHILNKYEVQTGQTHKSKGDMWEIQAEVVEEHLAPPNIFKRFVLPCVIVIAAVALLVVWIAGRREGTMEPPSSMPTAEEGIDTTGSRTGSVPPTEGGLRSGGEAGEEGSAPAGGQVPRTEGPPQPQRADEPSGGQPAPAGGVAAPATMTLVLIANDTDTTWFDLVTVSMIDGRADSTAHDFLLFPGRRATFRANESFLLRRVGNAGGFVMELDGRRLPMLGRKGEVVRNIVLSRADLPVE